MNNNDVAMQELELWETPDDNLDSQSTVDEEVQALSEAETRAPEMALMSQEAPPEAPWDGPYVLQRWNESYCCGVPFTWDKELGIYLCSKTGCHALETVLRAHNILIATEQRKEDAA